MSRRAIGQLTNNVLHRVESGLFWSIIGWAALILLGWAAYVYFISAFLRSFVNAV